jgi:ferric-dicitrate binding protein FerR (iron transport regulator)
MAKQVNSVEPGDQGIEQLLREVGVRDVPAPGVMEEVREAVHGEWRQMVEQRGRRKRFIGYAIAATVAGVAVAVTFTVLFVSQPAVMLAQVARVTGSLQVDPAGFGEWRAVLPGEQVKTGDTIRTDEGSSAALDFGNGVSLRIDAGSLIEFAAADRVALDHGGVYVDADPHGGAAHALIVETPYGSVRHLGTQYQVRASRNEIEVSIREGRVEIANAAGTHTGVAGEQLRVAREGDLSRGTISPHDPVWQWAARIAPAFDIEHQPLTNFLDWVARETGKQVVYATPEVQSQAAQLILRGSVDELSPEQALVAVLAPTSFAHRETNTTIEIHSQQQAGAGARL